MATTQLLDSGAESWAKDKVGEIEKIEKTAGVFKHNQSL
jgi:hypothetical protein